MSSIPRKTTRQAKARPTPQDEGDALPVAERRTQEQRREASEQRMLEAALALVAEKGTFRVTLAEIGERAGYSRGLPASRFGSKARLLAALATLIGERFGEHRQAFRTAPGLPSIEALIRAYFTREDWTTTRALIVMMAESALGDSELQPIIAAYNSDSHRYVQHHIALAQQAGLARADVDPKSLAVVVLSAFRGAMLQGLNDPNIDLARVRDELIALVRARLTPAG